MNQQGLIQDLGQDPRGGTAGALYLVSLGTALMTWAFSHIKLVQHGPTVIQDCNHVDQFWWGGQMEEANYTKHPWTNQHEEHITFFGWICCFDSLNMSNQSKLKHCEQCDYLQFRLSPPFMVQKQHHIKYKPFNQWSPKTWCAKSGKHPCYQVGSAPCWAMLVCFNIATLTTSRNRQFKQPRCSPSAVALAKTCKKCVQYQVWYVCMHACMYVCMRVCMHAWMDACMHVCMYVRTYVCKHVRSYATKHCKAL